MRSSPYPLKYTRKVTETALFIRLAARECVRVSHFNSLGFTVAKKPRQNSKVRQKSTTLWHKHTMKATKERKVHGSSQEVQGKIRQKTPTLKGENIVLQKIPHKCRHKNTEDIMLPPSEVPIRSKTAADGENLK